MVSRRPRAVPSFAGTPVARDARRNAGLQPVDRRPWSISLGPMQQDARAPREAGSHDERADDEAPRAFSLLEEARRHPGATVAFALCVVAGIALGGWLLPESISLPRRLAGGAIMGGLSWLLVMVGRLIGG